MVSVLTYQNYGGGVDFFSLISREDFNGFGFYKELNLIEHCLMIIFVYAILVFSYHSKEEKNLKKEHDKILF